MLNELAKEMLIEMMSAMDTEYLEEEKAALEELQEEATELIELIEGALEGRAAEEPVEEEI